MYFCFIKLTKCLILAVSNKGTGGGYPGVMGAGGLREAGEEGAGGAGYLKGEGAGRNGGGEQGGREVYGRRKKRGREGRDT